MTKKLILFSLSLILFGCGNTIGPGLPENEFRFYSDKLTYKEGDLITIKCGFYKIENSSEVKYTLENSEVTFLNSLVVGQANDVIIFCYTDSDGKTTTFEVKPHEIVLDSILEVYLPHELIENKINEFTITVNDKYLVENKIGDRNYGYNPTLPIKISN